MSTFTRIFFHIVFSTKGRMRTLHNQYREKLLGYICGVLRNKKSHVYRINMVEDHIHILCSIHRSESIADIVKLIKNSTSTMIKREGILPDFHGWQNGYGAFTVEWGSKDKLIEYIKDQPEHHKIVDFKTELKKILDECGIEYKDAYIE